MHKNISSKTPKARLNVVFSNSDCGINQFQGTDSVRPDPKHTQRSNKILFEHDPSFFLAYSDCLTSFRDIELHPSSFFRSNFEISKKMYTKPNFFFTRHPPSFFRSNFEISKKMYETELFTRHPSSFFRSHFDISKKMYETELFTRHPPSFFRSHFETP